MDGDELLTIGELGRLTGLPVKTIRFWSDEGLVRPADRTPAGYRLYDTGAVLRLGLIRTLRDLGIDLSTVRRVLEREVTIAKVAETHAAALEMRIRVLRLHQAVLRAVAVRGTATPEEIELMHRLAQLSDAERRGLINDFIDETFADLDLGPDFVPKFRSAMPDLPDEPTQTQIDAWVELAELVQNADFRASVRRAAVDQAGAIAEEQADGGTPQHTAEEHRAMADLIRDRVAAATEAGIQPASPEARPVADELVAAYAHHFGRTDTPEFRTWLLDRLTASSDSRYERYWQLLATINNWPVMPAVTPAIHWLITALKAT